MADLSQIKEHAEVIGADGVRSRTRTDMLMGPQAVYTGRVAWQTPRSGELRADPDLKKAYGTPRSSTSSITAATT